jgi:hypothetical protein
MTVVVPQVELNKHPLPINRNTPRLLDRPSAAAQIVELDRERIGFMPFNRLQVSVKL